MKIIIVGGGVVGTSLAQQLEKEQQNHRITLIEDDFDTCQKLAGKMDILTLHGSGLDADILIQAGITDADMIVAVTPNDETNILCCYVASRFSVPTRVARLKSSAFSNEMFGLEDLGVTDIIEPETEAINQIIEYLYAPALTEVINFRSALIAIRGFKVTLNSVLANCTAADVSNITQNSNILILMIHRRGETIVPNGDTVILPGDEILSLMPSEALPDFRRLFKESGDKIPKVVISGESQLTVALARRVEEMAKRTVIISESDDFCRQCADQLHNTDIFHGDPGNEDTLTDAGIHTSSYFISVDEDGEENIMSALMAKAEGAAQVIAVTNNAKHNQLFRTLGIDHLIQPTKLTTQRIFSDIAGFSKEAIFRYSKSDMDMGHFFVGSGSKLLNESVIDLRRRAKHEFIIGCIIRNNSFIVAHGQAIFEDGDELIVFYNRNDSKQITKLFKA